MKSRYKYLLLFIYIFIYKNIWCYEKVVVLPDFKVNSEKYEIDSYDKHYNPIIRVFNDNDFIVAWVDNYFNNFYIRKFNKDGIPLSKDIKVNDVDNCIQLGANPSLAIDFQGTITLAWEDNRGFYYHDVNIYSQRYNQYDNTLITLTSLISLY